MILVGETLFFSVEAATEINGEHSRWKIKKILGTNVKNKFQLFLGRILPTLYLTKKWGPENL